MSVSSPTPSPTPSLMNPLQYFLAGDLKGFLVDTSARREFSKETLFMLLTLFMYFNILNTFAVHLAKAWLKDSFYCTIIQSEGKHRLGMMSVFPHLENQIKRIVGYLELGNVVATIPLALVWIFIYAVLVPLTNFNVVMPLIVSIVCSISFQVFALSRFNFMIKGSRSTAITAAVLSFIVSFMLATRLSGAKNAWIYWRFSFLGAFAVSIAVAFFVGLICEAASLYVENHNIAVKANGFNPVKGKENGGGGNSIWAKWKLTFDSLLRWTAFMIPLLAAFLALGPTATLLGGAPAPVVEMGMDVINSNGVDVDAGVLEDQIGIGFDFDHLLSNVLAFFDFSSTGSSTIEGDNDNDNLSVQEKDSRIEDLFNKPNLDEKEEEEEEKKEKEKEELEVTEQDKEEVEEKEKEKEVVEEEQREPWSSFAVDCLKAAPLIIWGILRLFAAKYHVIIPHIQAYIQLSSVIDDKGYLVDNNIRLRTLAKKICGSAVNRFSIYSMSDVSTAMLVISIGLTTIGAHALPSWMTTSLAMNMSFIGGNIALWWSILCIYFSVVKPHGRILITEQEEAEKSN